ncbi:MAG: pyrimidine dimer DNA glycosylase/endonuclease V [Clostridia bacterium]|jgi:hypothetical protein|nr:pyrimidine dimer DNA glycosylase/endonuclease V [Clostridia bacterium]MDD4275431.1 pyrimidine dimer DNA glycosylase/endonuclease V [Clostridia bacterium]
MNIFVLDENKEKNAQYYVDRHVVKMILEYTLLLCGAFYYTDYIPSNIYGLCYKNHPASKWVRESLQNWIWLKDMTDQLIREYEYRYNKTHKCKIIVQNMPIPNLESKGLTPFPQIVPDDCKSDSVYIAYQNYYIKYKSHLFSWKNRHAPYFIK